MKYWVEPEAKGRVYNKFLVAVAGAHLDQRYDLETIFLDQMKDSPTQWVRYLDLLPPTRKHTTEEISQRMHEAGIDALVIVKPTGYSANKDIRTAGETVYVVSRPSARHEVEVWDVQLDKKVLTGAAKTQGDEGASYSTLIRSLANTLRSALEEQRMIPLQATEGGPK
jgi:hypothetical protein